MCVCIWQFQLDFSVYPCVCVGNFNSGLIGAEFSKLTEYNTLERNFRYLKVPCDLHTFYINEAIEKQIFMKEF